MRKGYTNHSLNQKSRKIFKTKYEDKEGIFVSQQGKFVIRVLNKGRGNKYITLSQHEKKEEAELAFKEYKNKK